MKWQKMIKKIIKKYRVRKIKKELDKPKRFIY